MSSFFSAGMSFKPQCAFHKHSEIAGDEELNMRKIVKKWPSSFVRILREKGVISPFGSYICITCITHIENTAEYSSLKGGHPYVGTVINDIDEGNLDPDDLHNIARALGRSQKNTVYCEAKSTSETYSNNLGDLDIQQLITNRNAVLVNFLLEITGLYGSSVENQRARFMPFICALDCILAAAYDRTVTPLLFLVSVLHYFVTGSKTVVNILSCLTPSGHYTILRKWFENYFSNKCLCPSGRDIISFFDNSQVLARNWRVRFNSKAMVSVITTLIHISPSVRTRLQYIPELDPSSWLYNAKLSIEQIVVLMFSLIENCNRVYDTYRDRFIKSTMDKVTHQQVLGSDLIDNHIEHPNLDIAPDNYIKDPYVFVPSTLETGSPSVSLGEPCMKNPCSYESVRSVMDHLLDVTKVRKHMIK